MSQPIFGDQSTHESSGQFGRLAFVVGNPASARAAGTESDRPSYPAQTTSDHECAKWLSERLTACYND